MRRLAALLLCMCLFPACAKKSGAPSSTAGTLQSIADSTLQTFSAVVGNSSFLPGKNRLVFAVLDKNQSLIRNLDVEVYYARATTAKPVGPVDATFEDDGLGDRAFYRSELDLPTKGKWFLLVREKRSKGKPNGAGTSIDVVESSPNPLVGDKAIPVTTPTLADPRGVDPICTREPNDPMHDISLDQALTNGKPTLVVFATPALCTSRVCGPVVDQVLRVRPDYIEKLNFIHVEVFTDKTGKTFTEGMKAWRLETEPWTYVINKTGVIKGAFEGPVTTGELKKAIEGVV